MTLDVASLSTLTSLVSIVTGISIPGVEGDRNRKYPAKMRDNIILVN